MFSKSKVKDNPPITSTVIGKGIKVEGAVISGSGSLRVDGNVIGDISIDGNIIVGDSGYIKGNIKVSNVLCAGQVDGNVVSSTGVHLTATGKLNGNISSNALVIDEGAIFTGNCQMSTDKASNNLVYDPSPQKTEDLNASIDPNLSFDKN